MAKAKNTRSAKPLPFGFNPKVEHRNSRLRRLIRKHGQPTPEQHDAAILAAGHKPIPRPAPEPINHALRKTLGHASE